MNWIYDSPFDGVFKMPGAVGIDQVNFRVPDDMPEGCAVPLRLRAEYDVSQPVPVTISRTPTQCTDPPPPSSGVLRLTRVRSSGIEPSPARNELYLELIQARDRRLGDEGDPDLVPTASFPVNLIRLKGPDCPGFEDYRGRPLDPGVITLSRDGSQPVSVTPVQNQSATWGYTAQLPPGFLDDGTVHVQGGGGADVGSFEADVEFPPFQLLTDLSPGTEFPPRIIAVNWTGGDPEDTLLLNYGDERLNGWHATAKVSAGTARISLDPPYPLPPGLKFQLTITMERAQPGTRVVRAPGLTLGARIERRLIYRFGGLVTK